MSERKIGAGHAAAMARLGLKELRNAANPSRESVADTEIGLYGTQTQGEIAEARGGPGQGPEQESSGTTQALAVTPPAGPAPEPDPVAAPARREPPTVPLKVALPQNLGGIQTTVSQPTADSLAAVVTGGFLVVVGVVAAAFFGMRRPSA